MEEMKALAECDKSTAILVTACDLSKIRGFRETAFDTFKTAICSTLTREREQHEVFEASSVPYDTRDLMTRLGCTERCTWCGALCWGERNHDEHLDDTSIHHSSHQPSGLSKTSHIVTDDLTARACHNYGDERRVYFGKFQEGMRWYEAKTKHFREWNFEKHYNTKFDELMRWFMQQLHVHIAQGSAEILPATEKELREHGCCDLNISEILSSLNQHFSWP